MNVYFVISMVVDTIFGVLVKKGTIGELNASDVSGVLN